MSGADLEFIRAEVSRLKQIVAPERILLCIREDRLEDLTIDTSVFISNNGHSDQSDTQYVKTFEDLIFRSLRCIFQQTTTDYLTLFKSFLENPVQPDRDPKGSYRYPLLEMYVRDRNIGGPNAPRRLPGEVDLLPYGYVTESGLYETSITCPTLFENYLRRQIRLLVRNHTPVIRVRTGPRDLPIHFAIEAHALSEIPEIPGLQSLIEEKIDMKMSNEIQLHFDVPELGSIDDIAEPRKTETIKVPSLDFINRHFFQRREAYQAIRALVRNRCAETGIIIEQLHEHDYVFRDAILTKQVDMKRDEMKREYEIRPLSIFNGNRIDYSLGRIRHYTKTSPAHFQNFVIFTNYQMYVEEFIKYGVANVLVGAAFRGDFCETEKILGELADRQMPISADRLQKIFDDSMEIAVPVYDKAGTSKRKDIERTFCADHIIQNSVMVVQEGACHFDRVRQKVLISESDLDTCLQLSLLKLFYGKQATELAATPAGKQKEAVFLAFATALFAYFLQGRGETGILGPKTPQMPAYHLKRANLSGISMVNIGVGTVKRKKR